ncbi:TIGR03749 family integrating conjugative element protein [Ectopseudomonas mendocina]|jgi:integrating conjugative element protein (TIGR03749 family)|uniref:TIGR03749 family integrating conjugative element protein n=1 Tax=Ectopseudomonas mendocina TaxID=300 RepID=A0ABD7RSV5_ECTME|nr:MULTISPECIES: TIGR03749 family integrating conjugative element protein [Pseudomonas]TRO12004.1 TIGR03749 family integrating conjugative element protein [Pseudomonas mendocina]TRO13978.1 TIGR03749 family integrating conjugative element protein [Pseudomonas mendocina]TRO36007.1 TIGR03749 family integrating conjugative element protein [Pseudomonas sp. ALS1131]
MNRFLPLALAAFALAPFSTAQATEILRWERLPLALPLRVDQERVVFVERNVRVGVPASLGNRLRVQSAAGAIYLLASEPIEPTRLQLQDADTGTMMLLDIAAEPAQDGQPPLEPVRIIEAASPATAAEADDSSAATTPVRATPQPVILTRFAAQNLYAPLRTVEPVPGVVRVTLRRDLPLDTLLPTLPVQAHALASWRLDSLWVSAVRLRNHSSHGLELDPRALQGHFLAATFQHPTLGPRGTPEDTTVVYLVTRGHGLAQALLPAIAPIDAALNLPAPTGGHDAQ